MGCHLVIACGGTGGHFYPTLAIAKAFQASGGQVTLLVSGVHAEEQLELASAAHIHAIQVQAERLTSKNPFSLVAFGIRFLKNALTARRLLQSLHADILLGMGSYASLPTCILKPCGLPLVLHEGNAFMGKANRLLAGRASAIGLSLPLADERQLKGCRHAIVGMPLRQALLDGVTLPADDRYLADLGLLPGRPTLLVFGGSQGAQFINTLMIKTAGLLNGQNLQILHLTGSDDNEQLIQSYQAAGIPASVRRAEPHIEKCYQSSSLVICRGGASTLCELALYSMPSIIIPLPSAADDHQSFNARLAVGVGGAIHQPQSQTTPQLMADIIGQLMAQPEKLRQMGQAIHVLAAPDAAQAMVNLIRSTLDKSVQKSR